jgi:DNA-binding transcriptional MerR regulator
MKELVQETSVPKTTIHFYLREGLLHAPEKTAVNAAHYDETHVERLKLIQRLRSENQNNLPLYLVKKVLELVDQDVDPDIAVALERAVLGNNFVPGENDPLTLAELTNQSGLEAGMVRSFVDSGLIIELPGKGKNSFDRLDVNMVRLYAEIFETMGWTARDLAPVSEKIGEISDYEWSLRDRTVKDLSAEESVPLRQKMQEFANIFHSYLFYRARLQNIESERIGKARER